MGEYFSRFSVAGVWAVHHLSRWFWSVEQAGWTAAAPCGLMWPMSCFSFTVAGMVLSYMLTPRPLVCWEVVTAVISSIFLLNFQRLISRGNYTVWCNWEHSVVQSAQLNGRNVVVISLWAQGYSLDGTGVWGRIRGKNKQGLVLF